MIKQILTSFIQNLNMDKLKSEQVYTIIILITCLAFAYFLIKFKATK